ncbi:hypothetical protein X975_19508, partial [Stegodyphus mimosarum]
MRSIVLASIVTFFAAFFSRSYAVEKTYLVSLRKAEFLKIVDCISKSRDPVLCQKYAVCEKELPPRIFAAHQKCQKEFVGVETLRCLKHAPLFKSPEIPAKIFDCILHTVKKLHPVEKPAMIKFEV